MLFIASGTVVLLHFCQILFDIRFIGLAPRRIFL